MKSMKIPGTKQYYIPASVIRRTMVLLKDRRIDINKCDVNIYLREECTSRSRLNFYITEESNDNKGQQVALDIQERED